mmetsp:Transcript_29407/g.5315  ORF Transcript_29407/g.5315 Transcript_29407/m.5315 type:complete len:101 (+) Transcript_29407:742-1044(+)
MLAEHEVNSSTSTVRHVASTEADIYTCLAGAIAPYSGRKHGGATFSVMNMLREIGTVENVPGFLEEVRNGKKLLFGFGHRIYKNRDPRTDISKQIVEELF